MRSRPLFALCLVVVGCGGDPAGIREVETDLERVIPTLGSEVRVIRAENDVAHIYAENLLDATRVQGFVTAQDRYVQLELLRRLGAGSTSQLLGDLGVDIDAIARGQGLKAVTDAIWASLSSDLKTRFEAYAEGVNAYIEVVKRGQLPLPEEIDIVAGLLDLDRPADAMQPITGYDIAAVAAVVVSRLGYETTDLKRQSAAQKLMALPDGKVKDGLLYDLFGAVAPVHAISEVMPSGQGLSPRRREVMRPLAIESSMLDRLVDRTTTFSKWIGKNDREFGSNAWAVSSKGTGGGAILANDGHLSLTIPSLFYQQCIDVAYFGDDDDDHVCGLFFPGFPLLAVGTNGHVAWGQTYLDADVTDFYAEEIQLGGDGLPQATRFNGEWRDVKRVDEEYVVGDDTVVVPRYETFDGRYLISVEGEVANGTGFFALGDWITPGDANADGKIEGVSFDWTAFDVGKTLEAVAGFGRAKSVAEFEAQTKKLVGYSQNVIVADEHGDVMFTGYHAMPCRDGLEKDDDGWVEGANPMQVLDGTKYGAFDIPLDANGIPQATAGCLIPFEAGPRVKTPPAGFVVTANHDPLGNAFDDSLSNDTYYIGGPYALGYRAKTISDGLAASVATGKSSIADTQAIQGDHTSPLGLRYGPMLEEALDGSDPRFAEVKSRLAAWRGRGGLAKSGVDTFYASYSAEERADAVATMIFNAWIRRFVELVFDEELARDAMVASTSRTAFRTLDRMLISRGENTAGLRSYDDARGESVLFDRVATASVTETSDDVMRLAMVDTLDALASDAYFDSTDMDTWLWGLEHQVRFIALIEEAGADNPLVGLLSFKFGLTTKDLPLEGGPGTESLEHFPRNGDWFGVDAANPGLFRRAYDYTHGPVMRMVIQLNDGEVRGENVLPGGQSGLLEDEHFADQAALWLGNRTIPLRYFAEEAVEGMQSAELFVKAR